MPGPEGSYTDLLDVLERVGVPWALAGALAAERYRARARFTTDVDLLVGWDSSLVEALETAGWILKVHREDEDPPFLIRARRDDLYVDLIIALIEYQIEALARATDHVLTIEDVLVQKTIAGRGRDREDIASILESGLEFDTDYVRHWVGVFGFEGRLHELGLA